MYKFDSQICQKLYDEEFASQFEQFLDRDPNTSLTSVNNEDTPGDNFVDHIVTHFNADNCPSFCSRLWSVCYPMIKCVGMNYYCYRKYCLDNKVFWVIFKYAPEGFLVYSVRLYRL